MENTFQREVRLFLGAEQEPPDDRGDVLAAKRHVAQLGRACLMQERHLHRMPVLVYLTKAVGSLRGRHTAAVAVVEQV